MKTYLTKLTTVLGNCFIIHALSLTLPSALGTFTVLIVLCVREVDVDGAVPHCTALLLSSLSQFHSTVQPNITTLTALSQFCSALEAFLFKSGVCTTPSTWSD